jgi:hypothetical protein
MTLRRAITAASLNTIAMTQQPSALAEKQKKSRFTKINLLTNKKCLPKERAFFI